MTKPPQLIVALDVPSLNEATSIVQELAPLGVMFKVGYEPLYGYGAQILETIAGHGGQYFLDAKMHDIPRTVAAAMRLLVRPGMRLVNVHALGGFEMMAQAVRAAQERAAELGIAPPEVLAVTMLTSMDAAAMDEIGIAGAVADEVLRLALLARLAGCAGVVAGVGETAAIKASLGAEFVALCPGVRPAGGDAGDQKRVATPAAAVAAGADYLVAGRPILAAADRAQATRDILAEMSHA